MERHNGLEPDPEGAFVYYDHAQATIAALQARVQELEDDRSAWKEIAQDWSAAAKLAEQPEKFYDGYSAAVMNAMQALLTKARADLTQRTAELEAAKADKVKWEEMASLRFAGDHKFVKEMELLKVENANLQAELERVRGERDDLRTLILALPKVEGEIEVISAVYNFILLKHDSSTRFLCAQIETEQTAQAIAALWQRRQGME